MPRPLLAPLTLVPELVAAAAHRELVVVVDVPQHVADHLLALRLPLALGWLLLAGAGLARGSAQRQVEGLAEVLNEHAALGLALVLGVLPVRDVSQLSLGKQPALPSIGLLLVLIRRCLPVVSLHADGQGLVLAHLFLLGIEVGSVLSLGEGTSLKHLLQPADAALLGLLKVRLSLAVVGGNREGFEHKFSGFFLAEGKFGLLVRLLFFLDPDEVVLADPSIFPDAPRTAEDGPVRVFLLDDLEAVDGLRLGQIFYPALCLLGQRFLLAGRAVADVLQHH